MIRKVIGILLVMASAGIPALGQTLASIPETPINLQPFYMSWQQRKVEQKLTSPSTGAVALTGNIYIFDGGNARIVKLDRSGKFLFEFGGRGSGPGQVQAGGITNALALDRYENVYVANPINPKIQIFNPEGQYVKSFRIPSVVDSIAVNSKGEIYISIVTPIPNPLIFVFSNDGKLLRAFGDRLVSVPGSLPRDISRTKLAFDSQDNLFVAFNSWPLIRKYSSKDQLIAEAHYQIPAELMDESQLRYYSIDFFTKNPNFSYSPPLLTFSISPNRDGGCYVLLNGAGIIKVDGRGAVVKERQFQIPKGNANSLFISLIGSYKSGELYMLDYRQSNIYKVVARRNDPTL
jgi:hypothetical protein